MAPHPTLSNINICKQWYESSYFEIWVGEDCQCQSSAVIMDGRTPHNNCESSPHAGYDGYKRRCGKKVHISVDTPEQLITTTVKHTGEQARARAKALCKAAQIAAGETVKLVCAD